MSSVWAKAVRATYTTTVSQVKNVYRTLFGKYLLVTNTVTYVSLYTFGDAMQQSYERYGQGKGTEHDFSRSSRFVKYACVLGPINHFWYLGLDKYITRGSVHLIVLKKLACDQIVFAPFVAVAFYMGEYLRVGEDSNQFFFTQSVLWTLFPDPIPPL